MFGIRKIAREVTAVAQVGAVFLRSAHDVVVSIKMSDSLPEYYEETGIIMSAYCLTGWKISNGFYNSQPFSEPMNDYEFYKIALH